MRASLAFVVVFALGLLEGDAAAGDPRSSSARPTSERATTPTRSETGARRSRETTPHEPRTEDRARVSRPLLRSEREANARQHAADDRAAARHHEASPQEPQRDQESGSPHHAEASPLAALDFEKKLDTSTFRALDHELDDASFARKWEASLVDASKFFRSYPNAFYRDFRELGLARIPGNVGLIFGDPHPENFGFLRLDDGPAFVFNDLDDSGRGPVALDALRYFTALRLRFPGDKKHFEEALDAYFDTLVDASAAPRIKHSFEPDWGDVAREKLAKYTSGDALRLGASTRLSSPPVSMRALLESRLAASPPFASYRILDVAVRARDGGGSGGLLRYWALAESEGKRTILEFKEATAPAVDQLGGRSLSPSRRLGLLKDAFWGAGNDGDHVYAKVEGTRFLVRDRLRMANLDLSELSERKLGHVVQAQAGILAKRHEEGWGSLAPDDIRAWLKHSSKVVAERWQTAFESAPKHAPR